MQFTKRVEKLAPEGAYFVFEKAQALEAKGRSIIHLEMGQPDFPTFENVSEAGIQAINNGHTRYTPPAGSQDLRRVIAEDAGKRRGIQFDPAQVVVGPGAKPSLFFPTLALVQPGDEVIYPDPGFPTYKAMIEVAGGVPVPVPLVEAQDFSFDLEVFDRLLSDKTSLIVLNSPSNPTGGVMPLSALAHIAEAAQRVDAWVLSDEIYSRLVFGDPAPSIAALPGMAKRTVVCDGFSKTYAMTGWRLGYGIMPVGLADRVALLQTHSIGCTADFTQVAGVEAVTGPQEQVEDVVDIYRQRRDAMVAGLNAIPGLSARTPQGAFYVFPNITAFGISSDELADYILEEAGVAVLPGTSFGEYGEGYLRLCFANSLENIELALEQIAAALAKLS
ncbi:MAG TPA: pyridoxal phosphate-dependent aminotransferase [Anaerolineales bacterium]|nr:pyridoxal phosphate-dependent aminotransferase [Anaerolineales bacterium]